MIPTCMFAYHVTSICHHMTSCRLHAKQFLHAWVGADRIGKAATDCWPMGHSDVLTSINLRWMVRFLVGLKSEVKSWDKVSWGNFGNGTTPGIQTSDGQISKRLQQFPESTTHEEPHNYGDTAIPKSFLVWAQPPRCKVQHLMVFAKITEKTFANLSESHRTQLVHLYNYSFAF